MSAKEVSKPTSNLVSFPQRCYRAVRQHALFSRETIVPGWLLAKFARLLRTIGLRPCRQALADGGERTSFIALDFLRLAPEVITKNPADSFLVYSDIISNTHKAALERLLFNIRSQPLGHQAHRIAFRKCLHKGFATTSAAK